MKVHMKAVQFTVDDKLLNDIDRHPETRRHGRSAFLRLAARELLRRRREAEIDAAYERAYRRHPPEEGEFFVAPEAQAWPDE